MSRIGKAKVLLPDGVGATLLEGVLEVVGPKGRMEMAINPNVEVEAIEGGIVTRPAGGRLEHWPITGTVRANIANMVTGVSVGFERKLVLVGVGYRAQVKGNTLSLALGFSHPIEYQVPEGIAVTASSPTEVVVQGLDKQKVGQVAAEIRAYRRPEPYKGKGVRYDNEMVRRKEAKKK